METGNAVRSIAKERGFTQDSLASELGVSQAAAWKIFRESANPSVGVLSAYLAPMGYQVALVPVGTKLPNGCYVIESSK